MKVRNLFAAAALAVAGTVGHASTIALNSTSPIGPEAIGTIPGQDFTGRLAAAGVTHLFSGPMTLITDGPVKLKFTLVASESNFRNSLLFGGTTIITENGDGGTADFATGTFQGQSYTLGSFDGDLASVLTFEARDFGSGTTLSFNSGQDEFGVFADSAQIGALKTFYLALDDSGANLDDNHDDIIVRVDVAAIPLPASALLLLTGLGGAFGIRRLRKTA